MLFSSDVSRRKGSHDLEQKFSRPAIRAASPVRFWVPWRPEASVNSLLLFKMAMRLVAESVLGPARSVARFGTLFPRPITMHYIKLQVSRKQASIHTYILKHVSLLSASLLTFSCLHTHIYCIQTNIHAYIHTYIHTYIHRQPVWVHLLSYVLCLQQVAVFNCSVFVDGVLDHFSCLQWLPAASSTYTLHT